MTYPNLQKELNAKLKDPNLNNTITSLGIEYIYDDVFKFTDGVSSQRVLSKIKELLIKN